jgi:hypothetical protein
VLVVFADAGNKILTQEKTVLEEWGIFDNKMQYILHSLVK